MSQAEKKHTCVLCNTVLESKESLQDHFRKHANKEIDLKGRAVGPGGLVKQTTSNGSYIKGSGSQVNTNIVCDVCGEAFTCNTKAIQHKFRKHPFNAAKHYCPQCGMQFPLQGHRDKHLKDQHESDHVPRNPYPCYQCGAVFYNKAAHEYHDKSAHHRVVTLYKQILTPPPSKKIRYNNAGEPQSVYYCHLCGLEYIVKFNLQKHIERQHPPEERNVQPAELFKCNTCDALFYNPKAYHNHNIYHRPDDLYVTSEEQRLQTVTRVDQDFDIRRVQPPTERYIPKYRRRRTSIAAPRLSLLISKTKEDEEMSPPPNSDSDDSEEEPPHKKQTKPLNTHSANNKKAAVENNENTQKELSVDTKEKSAVSNDTNSIKNSDDSSLSESATKSLADLDNKTASEAPGLTLTDDDLGKCSVSVEPSDLGSLPEVASPSAPSAAPVSPRAVNSGTGPLGDLETPEEPILQAL